MLSFTVHDIFKIARFTDTPCVYIYIFILSVQNTHYMCVTKFNSLTTSMETLAEDSDLREYDAVYLGEWFPAF
jgi:hypothetical protein